MQPATQYKRILVPADGSEGAHHAALAAAELARLSGGRLFAVHVVAPAFNEAMMVGLGMPAPPMEPVLVDPNASREDPALVDIETVAREKGVPVHSEQIMDSRPAHAIAAAAMDNDCDLIVMSSHGYGSLLSLITGSTTAKVVAESTVPVLVVH